MPSSRPPSAEKALALLDDGFVPSLVMTDHLVPGMSGADPGRHLCDRNIALA
jgi:hypothetical protein